MEFDCISSCSLSFLLFVIWSQGLISLVLVLINDCRSDKSPVEILILSYRTDFASIVLSSPYIPNVGF